jgi:K+-transporting ATPase ATPase C chain
MSEEAMKAVIRRHTQGRLFGIIGEPVVNVLEVNLSLKEQK